MFEKENDLTGKEMVIECPCDSNHKVCVSGMARHLGECRKTVCVSETAICPFNKNREINVPELNFHKQTCPDKRDDFENVDDDSQEPEKLEVNGGNREKDNGSNFDSNFASDAKSTGCLNRRPDGGGIHNHISDNQKNDEKRCETPTETEELVTKQVCGPGEAVAHNAVIDEPPNHNAVTENERRFSLSESDTASSENETTEASNGAESMDQTTQVQFDYKKFAPSPEEKEDFLKKISQEKENQWYVQEKYQAAMNQGYCLPQWYQGYGTYFPPQYPILNGGYVPHAYVTFTNGYPMMAPVPAQPPYQNGPYIVPQAIQGNGCYIPGSNHGISYDYGGNYRHRSHYHRSYKRRGYPAYSHPRNNNNYHSYNSYNGHNSTDTDSNSTTSSTPSDSGSVEENGFSHKSESLHPAYEPSVNSNNKKKNSAKQQLKEHLPGKIQSKTGLKVEKAKVNFEQFMKIEKVEAGKQINGKIEHVIAFTQKPNHNSVSNTGAKSEKDKQIRKLRKKLNEVLSLEEKKEGGAKLDCDQLKKLTRKRELEDQLAQLENN